MKNFLYRLWVLCAALVFASHWNVRASEADQSAPAATNGVYASGKYIVFYPNGGHVIRLFVHFRPPSTNISSLSPFPMIVKSANGDEVGVTSIDVGIYFLATNSFCGFIELRDQSGDKITLLKPEMNLPESYPNSYNLKIANRLLMEKTSYIGADKPGCLSGTDPEQCRFHLKDYFKIEKPGDYQLTVWPKIYKRSETNRDLCDRIDLPPVTIPIKWTDDASK